MQRKSHKSDDDLVTRSITESREIFVEKVWPIWAGDVSAREIISVEGAEADLERSADFSGTDAFFVRKSTGILIPIASRVEFFNQASNNPFESKYRDHYPRFTIRLAKRRVDGSLSEEVECAKRIRAIQDDLSRRYLPLFTFQSLVAKNQLGRFAVMQTLRVRTDELFDFVLQKKLHLLSQGRPSYTLREGDAYRIITAEKLIRAGIDVVVHDFTSSIQANVGLAA